MNEQTEKALDCKDDALAERNSGHLKEARALIDEAASLLDEVWEQKKDSINSAGPDASPDERELVKALAETYGVKGGILRSSGEFENAVRAYDKGATFEQHPALKVKVENSYNLIQRLTNRVLAEPHQVGAEEWNVFSKDMWRELGEARDVLQRQINTGGRGNDPWAAADMITVQLLLAPRDPSNGAQRVEEAYTEFEKLEPKPRVYESTLRALEDLQRCLEQLVEDGRSENRNLIVGLLDLVTKRLRDGFEKAKSL